MKKSASRTCVTWMYVILSGAGKLFQLAHISLFCSLGTLHALVSFTAPSWVPLLGVPRDHTNSKISLNDPHCSRGLTIHPPVQTNRRKFMLQAPKFFPARTRGARTFAPTRRLKSREWERESWLTAIIFDVLAAVLRSIAPRNGRNNLLSIYIPGQRAAGQTRACGSQARINRPLYRPGLYIPPYIYG